MTKIALLSDIHGNTTALEAVLEDSRKAKVDEYWLLGDSLMPGTGRRALLELLEELPITVKVLGNWEDSLCWMRPDPVIATSCASVNIFLKKSRPRKLKTCRKCPCKSIEKSQV